MMIMASKRCAASLPLLPIKQNPENRIQKPGVRSQKNNAEATATDFLLF
jgi:hypothetical protein